MTTGRVRKRAGVVLLALLTVAPGCAYKYTFRTDLPPAEDASQMVREWRHIGLWGWIPAAPFNLDEACPEGVSEFGSYVSFLNWTCAFLTAGLYSPRTVYAIPAAGSEA